MELDIEGGVDMVDMVEDMMDMVELVDGMEDLVIHIPILIPTHT